MSGEIPDGYAVAFAQQEEANEHYECCARESALVKERDEARAEALRMRATLLTIGCMVGCREAANGDLNERCIIDCVAGLKSPDPDHFAEESEADALRARVAELEGVLRELEWAGFSPEGQCALCRVCGMPQPQGHLPDCRLAAALKGAKP